MADCEFINKLRGRQIILASGSPRRRELLAGLGVKFVVDVPSDVDESHDGAIAADDVAPMLARRKAEAYRRQKGIAENMVVICADTVVILDREVLGKPADDEDARRMLRSLSGKTHKVVTGVCVATASGCDCRRQTTEVTFSYLTDGEIDWYVENYRPLDKAGAYGIQEWIGYVGIAGISGDYYNVMGLPVNLLYRMLLDVTCGGD